MGGTVASYDCGACSTHDAKASPGIAPIDPRYLNEAGAGAAGLSRKTGRKICARFTGAARLSAQGQTGEPAFPVARVAGRGAGARGPPAGSLWLRASRGEGVALGPDGDQWHRRKCGRENSLGARGVGREFPGKAKPLITTAGGRRAPAAAPGSPSELSTATICSLSIRLTPGCMPRATAHRQKPASCVTRRDGRSSRLRDRSRRDSRGGDSLAVAARGRRCGTLRSRAARD